MPTWSPEQINSRLDAFAVWYRTTVEKREGLMFLTMVVGLATAISLVALTIFVIGSHADGYRAADVGGDQAAAGAIVAQVFVAATTVAAVLLFRNGRPGLTRSAAAVAGGLLLLFAILPNVVGGNSWLTTFLAVLTALLLHLLIGAVAGVLTVLTQVGAFSS